MVFELWHSIPVSDAITKLNLGEAEDVPGRDDGPVEGIQVAQLKHESYRGGEQRSPWGRDLAHARLVTKHDCAKETLGLAIAGLLSRQIFGNLTRLFPSFS